MRLQESLQLQIGRKSGQLNYPGLSHTRLLCKKDSAFHAPIQFPTMMEVVSGLRCGLHLNQWHRKAQE